MVLSIPPHEIYRARMLEFKVRLQRAFSYEIDSASAGVLQIETPCEDVGPVPCARRDCVWEIMLKFLSAMYVGI